MKSKQTMEPATIGAKKRMSSNNLEWWSSGADILAVSGLILGAIVTIVAIAGWVFSWKAGKLKEEALKQFKTESATRIAEADAKAAEANKIAALATSNAAKANERAAASELELARLKADLAPRRYTSSQVAAMIPILQSFPRRPKLEFWYRQPNAEAQGFANQIANILTSAGFKDGNLNGMWDKRLSDGKPIPDGITLNASHPDKELVDLFARAFEAAGVDLPSASIDPSDGAPILCIGHKK